MKKFNVTITISYQQEVEAADESDAKEEAWTLLLDRPYRYADVLVEEVEEKK